MPTIHLIHGFVGAGKTTFSKKLAAERGALRLSPDDWMGVLYGANPPAEHFAEYDRRIKTIMWETAVAAIGAGADVILDYGFWRRADRDDYRARAAALGAEAILYCLQCPEDVMRKRALKRTAERPPGALFIDENALNVFMSRYEKVNFSEEHAVIIDSSGESK